MGDLVDYGPSPNECIALLREKDSTVVRGNHDNAVAFGVDCGCGYEIKALSQEVRKYTNSVITKENKEYLKDLPIYRSVGDDFLTHASPEDMFRYLRDETPEEEFDVFFDKTDSDRIFLGHTHETMDRTIQGKRFINPGSLGQPRDGDPRASYFVLEDGELEKKRVEYNMEKVIKRMDEVGLPDRAKRILKAGKVVD